MPKSVYIHIPFCIKKCAYCSFLSGISPMFKADYTDSLIKEIKKFYEGTFLNTIYFGGGTPSLLEPLEVKKILDCFNFNKDCEITLEMNPKTANLEKLKAFFDIGINRISLGVQSFDDNILKIAGRIHNSNEALKSIEDIKNAGFKNFSIDLMYGLPHQTLKIWQNTLEQAKKLALPHISLYGLKIEQGSDFYSNPPKNLPDNDTQADMYEMALEVFNDYCHYEFSNFAKAKDFFSRHNLNYWNVEPYWGFGVAAAGFTGNKRYENENDFEKYLKNPTSDKNFYKTNLLEEHIFLGFRKSEGINKKEISEKFSIDFDEKYANQLDKFISNGLIQKTLHGYKLTKTGVMLSNLVLCEFLDD